MEVYNSQEFRNRQFTILRGSGIEVYNDIELKTENLQSAELRITGFQ